MAPELIASEDIAPDDMAPDDIGSEVMSEELMASEEAAEVEAAAAEVLLDAVSELDPQAASVRARAAPATRVRARFINISVLLGISPPRIGAEDGELECSRETCLRQNRCSGAGLLLLLPRYLDRWMHLGRIA
jgi:hypothetical protein